MGFKSRVDISTALFLACVLWSWRSQLVWQPAFSTNRVYTQEPSVRKKVSQVTEILVTRTYNWHMWQTIFHHALLSTIFTDHTRSMKEGNVFTRVCDSVQREGMGYSATPRWGRWSTLLPPYTPHSSLSQVGWDPWKKQPKKNPSHPCQGQFRMISNRTRDTFCYQFISCFHIRRIRFTNWLVSNIIFLPNGLRTFSWNVVRMLENHSSILQMPFEALCALFISHKIK